MMYINVIYYPIVMAEAQTALYFCVIENRAGVKKTIAGAEGKNH